MNIKNKLFLYSIVGLFILTAGASYVRFVILHDYLVSYQTECDPSTASCFTGCEDEEGWEECAEPFYYSIITRPATELESLCNTDVSNCAAAKECGNSLNCSVTFCDDTVGEDVECYSLANDS